MPTPRPERPRSSIQPWRAWLAAVVGLAMVLGVAAPHASAAEHQDSPAGAAVDRSARHPGEPVHVEGSAVEFRLGCPLCILQLQTTSVLRAPRAALPTLLRHGDVLPTVQQADSTPVSYLGPARAPPFSLSAL